MPECPLCPLSDVLKGRTFRDSTQDYRGGQLTLLLQLQRPHTLPGGQDRGWSARDLLGTLPPSLPLCSVQAAGGHAGHVCLHFIPFLQPQRAGGKCLLNLPAVSCHPDDAEACWLALSPKSKGILSSPAPPSPGEGMSTARVMLLWPETLPNLLSRRSQLLPLAPKPCPP